MSEQAAFDYVVVGGGSAGCVAAARLAEAGAGTVLLLEAGEPVEANPETMTADGFKYAFANDRVMWDRMSARQADAGRRSLYQGSGTGLGGSGSVNGMVYTRGDRRDFEQWPAGWQWDDIAPAFDAVEQQLRVRSRPGSTFTEMGVAAATAAGFRRKDGLNDGDLCGFIGYNTMNYEGESRRSSYLAFVHGRQIAGLTVRARTLVHRILFDAQQNAVGVEVETQGRRERIGVNAELILCAGALETPKLLMLSGVGPRRQLEQFGIEVLCDAPAIGQNLHDHPNVCLFYRGRRQVDFGHPQVYGFQRTLPSAPLAAGQADTCYTYLAAPITLKQSMYRMLPALALPGKWFYNRRLRGLFRKVIDLAFRLPALQRFVDRLYGVVVILGKPQSRGQLRLASADVRDQADIDPAYYSERSDMETMLNSVALAKHIASQQGFREWGNTPLVAANRSNRPSAVEKWIVGATMTTFHYCGSCSMGDAGDAPVGPDLKLRGVGRVRVADASVIPEIPVSAINAPSMMIGYRAAAFIVAELGDAGKAEAVNQ